MKIIKTMFFIVIWFILVFWQIVLYDDSLFSISNPFQTSKVFSSIKTDKKILQDNIVTGEFTAKEKNLGILNLRFDKSQIIPFDQQDVLIFRIKQKEASNWYVQNKYRSGLISNSPFFPFGFPEIVDSKNKTYVFELISTRGNELNAVRISDHYPIVEAKYIVEREEVKKSIFSAILFLYKKIIYKITVGEIIFSFFIAALPLPLYASVLNNLIANNRLLRKFYSFLKKKGNISIFIFKLNLMTDFFVLFILVITLVDVIVIKTELSLIYLFVFIAWILNYWGNENNEKLNVSIILFLLVLAPTFLGFGLFDSAIKAGAWALIFFASSFLFSLKKTQKIGTNNYV